MALNFLESLKQEINDRKKVYLYEHSNVTDYKHLIGAASDTGVPGSPILSYRATNGNTILINMNTNYNDRTIIHGSKEYHQGKEGQLTYDQMQFTVAKMRWVDMIKDKSYEELKLGIPTFVADLRRGLLKQAEFQLSLRIVQAFGHCFSFNSRMASLFNDNVDNINRIYSFDDMIANMLICTANTVNANGDSISTDRIVFGSNDIAMDNGNTIDQKLRLATSGKGNNNEEGMSVNFIRKMKMMAQRGSRKWNGVLCENKIYPYKLEAERHGYSGNQYILYMGLNAYDALSRTADWKSFAYRGVIESDRQPTFLSGTNYRGTVEGVSVVTDDNFDNYAFKGSDGAANANANFGYCVLMGNGALAYGMSGTPEMDVDEEKLDKVLKIQHEEISGIMPIKFGSKLNVGLKGNRSNNLKVEAGIIHGFASIG